MTYLLQALKDRITHWHSCWQKLLNSLPYLKNRKITATILPSDIDDDEKLARHLCGGKKNSSIRKLYNPDTQEANPSQFMDTRKPSELSVDRVSTLSLEQALQLGVDFFYRVGHAKNPSLAYHGYARLLAKHCRGLKDCSVKPETYNDTLPFHANIHFPSDLKEDDMDYANELVKKAELFLHPSAPQIQQN